MRFFTDEILIYLHNDDEAKFLTFLELCRFSSM